MKARTGRTIPIYPRLTLTNREWLSARAEKINRSESEIIDKIVTHARKTMTLKQFKEVLDAKTGNEVSR